jgi:diguanylate cyclase (GGDEF)-like protein
METPQTTLIELIDKVEQLGRFQDRVELPATVERIWEAFLKDARELIDIEGCALFRVGEPSQGFSLSQAQPAADAAVYRKEIEAQIEYGIFPWVLKRRQPALTPSFTLAQTRSAILLPLATAKSTLGMVLVVTPLQESLVTQEKMRLLSVLSRQCSLVMENAVLYDKLLRDKQEIEEANKKILYLSQHDALTDCYNRGHMNAELPRELRRSLRYRRPLSLTLCDIDHFKTVNDSYGHACGDMVLKEFVKSVKELVRDSDWLARYGGEEFLLVLPETSLENAARLAERLRAHIGGRKFAWEKETIAITASFGVVGIGPEAGPKAVDAETLLNLADDRLYQAKKNGRDQVVSGPFPTVAPTPASPRSGTAKPAA